VRDLGEDRARLELDAAALASAQVLLAALDAALLDAGFAGAHVDPQGFRSGAMNELLATPERYR